VGYGTSSHFGGYDQIPHVHTPVTDDQVVFQNAVNQLVATGGLEEGYRVVYESATDTIAVDWQGSQYPSLQFTGAPYCNILITDEDPDQQYSSGSRTLQEAIDAMVAAEGHFFGVLPNQYFGSAQPIADATGGQLFDLAAFRANATPVIEAVLAACVEVAIPVKIDIKPGSCPNPFNLTKKGVLPVALLGSEEFDVTSIVPETLRLEGDCPALRWSLEDVATPYDGEFSDPPVESDCTTAEGDGWTDLTVKFDSQCIAMTQGALTDWDVRLWTLTGKYLNDEGDEIEFEAQDVVRVMP
jgi:hypothetical protein